MTGPDLVKAKREQLRWLILKALDAGRPLPVHQDLILSVAQAVHADANLTEIRRELDYLEKRELVSIRRDPAGTAGPWKAELDRFGIEVVEYTVECDAGIARPPKYW